MRIEIKNIICATDFSDYSNQVFHYGKALAKEFDARIFACHIVDPPPVSVHYEACVEPAVHVNFDMGVARDELALIIGQTDILWEPHVAMGYPAEEIAALAEKTNADLVISATHGRSGLKRLIIGSVTERLMRILPCPLLIVRGQENQPAASSETALQFKRIVVGCDFSDDSDQALQYAFCLAQEFESELHLLHVVEPLVYIESIKASRVLRDELMDDLQTRLQEKMLEIIPKDVWNWCHPKTILLKGQPHDMITGYARENNADLIVLGVRGHGLMEQLFVGSTTDRVARRAPCPILSVSPKITIQPQTQGG